MIKYVIIIIVKVEKEVITIKKIIKILCSISICLLINFNFTGIVSAEKIQNFTILGDSISNGYGLSKNELSYENYLEQFYNCSSENFAVNGQTTNDLLDYIKDDEISESIKNSDIICISIGGNDLFQILNNYLKSENKNLIADDGNLNITLDFTQKFISEYSDDLKKASSKAAENIKNINDEIKEINPDAKVLMLTVYNPFECSDPDANDILKPLKDNSANYLDEINSAIKNNSDKTADTFLKFSEKSYLYTNMDNFDIHPNSIGHMLIAEEIVQVLSESGDFKAFSNAIYNIPQGIFSNLPEYTASELNSFAEGNLRNCTLEQLINDKAETENSEIDIEDENSEPKKVNKTKQTLSKIFLIAGMSLILAVSLRRYIRKRR